MLLFMIPNIAFSLIHDQHPDKYKWMCYYLVWFFLRAFEVLNIVYPILLVIYYTKLYELNHNKTFDQVKRVINRLELIVILIIASILIVYLAIGTVPNFAILIDSE